MKNLKTISLFKLVLFSLLAIFINNIFIYILFSLYFLFSSYKYLLLYIAIVLTLIFFNTLRTDFIPIGIIEDHRSDYYVVDKLLYKTKLISDDDLNIGDILYFKESYKANKYTNELKHNINYYGYSYHKLFNFKPRLIIRNYINSFKNDSVIVLNKFLYNINNYDDISFNVTYVLVIYYLFRYIGKKNDNLCIVLLLIYSLLFVFQIKFYLLIIDIILNRCKLNKLNKYAIKLLIIYLFNPNLFFNYSIIITLLINLYSIVNINVSFRMFYSIIQSILFGEINIINLFLYQFYLMLQLFILVMCFILLIIPSIENYFLIIVKFISDITSYNISIRGKISIISILILLYVYKIFRIDNQSVKLLLLLLIIISPINNPLMHISFIDVGQGDAILIKYPLNLANILIDTGSKYNYNKLKTYLYKQGIYKIDYLIISHNDEDHNGNVISLTNDFKVKEIVKSGKDIRINNSLLKYYYIDDFDNDNDNSLVYLMDINGYKFLFTGDISEDVEKKLINKYSLNDVDVLKVSHHGSYTATSKYLLSNTLPKYAIISTSGMYKHPSDKVIANLDDYLVRYFITKDDGNIEFYFTGIVDFIRYKLFDFVVMRN